MRVPRTALVAFALMAAPAAAQQEVVVTGKPLSVTERELAECLARNCPPDEDIAATLAHAENLFVAGDYEDSRSVLRASVRRNGDEAGAFPVEVSYLQRATGRIAAHLGHNDEYHTATWSILRALKEGIPDEDYRHLGARLEIAGMMAVTRGPKSGIIAYDEAAEKAEELGRADLAMLARIRSAWLSYQLAPFGTARKQLTALAATPDPALRPLVMAAKIMLARIAAERGDQAAIDALIGELAATPTAQPVLLHSPPWDASRAPGPSNLPLNRTVAAAGDMGFNDQWIDVGFWVRPDGKVAEVEVLRRSGDGDWALPLLESIGGRLYSPTDPVQGGAYRVERYTYTFPLEKKSGSRFVGRSDEPRIEYLDLTASQPQPSADSGS